MLLWTGSAEFGLAVLLEFQGSSNRHLCWSGKEWYFPKIQQFQQILVHGYLGSSCFLPYTLTFVLQNSVSSSGILDSILGTLVEHNFALVLDHFTTSI